ncbi:hypothetical protein C8046_12535 [Serinibacter arcticus]|uniref:SLH domain-containing protein n=2 Tax=Serinibacter arcticus TaxID=1655435 RepID=A0A2U1ZWJ7_9MICO|nr:hypothetical protein C8046_12535 [Serinibacter arcticus]
MAAALAVGLVPSLVATGAAAAPGDGVPSTDTPITYTTFGAIQDGGLTSAGYFQPFWYDTDGRHIQAHGGQTVTVQEAGETVHYWYGEDRSNGYWGSPGVAVYRSTDLMNWTNEGTAMRSVSARDELTEPYFDDLYGTLDASGQPDDARIDELNFHLNTTQAEDYTAIFERPKVLYNDATDEWVMWWHSDGRITPGGSTYARSFAAVAVADSPTGPFRMTGAYRLYNRANYQACTSSAVPGQARDMTVFKDADGTAYISYSSEENYSLYIAKLNADYTNVEHTVPTDTIGAHQYSEDGEFPYIFADGTADAPVRGEDFQIVKECGHLEAPAIFANGDTYATLASGATGWGPNPQTYYTADDLLGTWIRGVEADDVHENVNYASIPEGGDGLLSVGDVRKTTFGSQGTNVITLAPGKYVYMGDRWNEGKNDSTYVWLPLTVGENGRLEMHNPAIEDPARWGQGWDASYWDDKGYGVGTWSVTEDGLVDTVARGTDPATVLPTTVTVDSAGTTRTTGVTWSDVDLGRLGKQTVTGTLDGDATFADGRTFRRTITVTADGIVNIAPLAAVTVSSRSDLAGRLTDGDVKGKGWDDWAAAGAYPRSSTLTFAWDAPRTLDSIAVHTYKDSGVASWPSAIAVQVRDQSGAWVDSPLAAQLLQDPSLPAPTALLDATELPEVTGVRLRLTSEADTWQAISEVEIWGDAPPVNVCRAPGSTVSASFHQTRWNTFPAAGACDGNAGTSWSTWSDTDLRDSVTFTIEAAQAHLLDRVSFTNIEGTIASVGVEYRDVDGTWTPTSAQDVAPAANSTVTTIGFDDVTATGLRLTFATPGSYLKITEIQVPEKVVAPVVSPFLDVPVDNEFFTEIAWLAEQRISTGWTTEAGVEFRPLAPIARDAMAAFLYRMAGSPEFTAPTTSPFTDVPTTNLYYDEIAWLADQEISTGWAVGAGAEFRPLEPIARDAMAAFLYRYAGAVLGTDVEGYVTPTTSRFEDVSPATLYHREISWLADAEISTGWDLGEGRAEYRPLSPVARDAMAAFLYRSVDGADIG